MMAASRGLCPCDPRIYRFDARIVLERGSGSVCSHRDPGLRIGARVASLRCSILRPAQPQVYNFLPR